MADRGYGRKSWAAICSDLNIPLADALARLKSKEIAADGQMILKDLSAKNNIMPVDLVHIIQGEKESIAH